MNQARHLLATAERTPDRPALITATGTISYAGLLGRARRYASTFTEAGVGSGDRIAVWTGNEATFADALYGAWLCGAVVVPVHAGLTEPEARHVLSDSGSKVVVAGPLQADVAHRLGASLSLQGVFVGDEGLAAEPAPEGEVVDDGLALIAYTAGTSGTPKGAMLSHDNLESNIGQMRQTTVAFSGDDVILCILPLFHIYGLNVVLNLAVSVGATIVLAERFDPVASAASIAEHGVTVIAGAPQAYVAWLGAGLSDDAFSDVRVAVSGAAALPREVLEGFADRFGVTIWEGYGLTETSPALTTTAVGGTPKPGCVGRPVPGVALRLVDASGEDVEDGDPGEIIVAGPNVFSGYWHQEAETAAAFLDEGEGRRWFRTGDIAVADDEGDIFIVDRGKDMVNVSGFNVYPREVEDVLRRHPHVGDVAVVGAPDEQTGEHVRAIVVPDPPGEGVEPAELIEFCSRSLAHYKIPSEIEIVSDIPRNAAGKVLRRELRGTDRA